MKVVDGPGLPIGQVIEAMVDVVLVVDIHGRIPLVNTAAELITGYSRGEFAELAVTQLLIDEQSGVRTEVRKRVANGDALRREESWLVTKAGTRIPVSVTAAAIVDDRGDARGIVLVVRDTREVRQLLADRAAEIERREAAEIELRRAMASIEERLEQARSQLVLAERRATLGTLAGGVGHELRNIAQIHVQALETLHLELEGLEIPAFATEALGDLARVGEHISTHGTRLMRLARPGPEYARPLNLPRTIRDVVSMVQGAGKLRDLELVFGFDDQPLLVTVNQTRIEQILVNLLVNAADAMRGTRGKIMLAVHPIAERRRALVEVTDTGPGIPPEILPKIFDPFFTTKSEEEGTGLGLPVVREIVRSYGGELAVRSTVGVGTTFTFDLPLSG